MEFFHCFLKEVHVNPLGFVLFFVTSGGFPLFFFHGEFLVGECLECLENSQDIPASIYRGTSRTNGY